MEYKDLEKFGLNKNEAKVYYSLLKLGSASAAEIVKQLGIHRNIVYDNLEKLIEKGLVSYVIQATKKIFTAQEPNVILEFLNKKKEKIDEEISIAKEIIPKIKNLKIKNFVGQESQIFRGINGIKKVLFEILESKENWVMGMTNKSTEMLGETFWGNYNARIKDKKIKERFLLNSDFKEIYSFRKNKNIQIKILPKELNQITEIILFEGKIAIFVYSENPLVFLIKDQNLYDTYEKQFEFLWKKSKNLRR